MKLYLVGEETQDSGGETHGIFSTFEKALEVFTMLAKPQAKRLCNYNKKPFSEKNWYERNGNNVNVVYFATVYFIEEYELDQEKYD